MMGGSFVPLVWMIGLSNYYTGSRRPQSLGLMVSVFLGFLTFVGSMTAVVTLMAICGYDLSDSTNQSSIPINILSLFLLSMDLWLDRPSKLIKNKMAAGNKSAVNSPEANVADVVTKSLNLAAIPEHERVVECEDDRTKEPNDLVALIAIFFATLLSMAIMIRQANLGGLWTWILGCGDSRTILGIALAMPICLMAGINTNRW